MRTNQPFIPFLRANADLDHLDSFYSDAPLCRITLDRDKWVAKIRDRHRIWIDLAFDGIRQSQQSPDYVEYLKKHGDLSPLTDAAFAKSPKRASIENQIVGFLDEAHALSPFALSIPQLPQEDGTETNKINKLLYAITLDWRNSKAGSVKLVLPVIFTNQRQLNKKTDRNPKIAFIKSLLASPGADAIWITDHTLEDQAGTGNFDKERFPGVIDFFKEFKAVCNLTTVVAGPFWGLGIVLWARGLCTHFGIGLGSTYRYYLAGGMANKPKARVAIGALRRWVCATPELEQWLKESLKILPVGSPEARDLQELLKHLSALLSSETAKRQVARVYREWIDKISGIPPAGRGVALFQDLTAAFVTGKSLPDLPDESGPARRPERVAEQLMLNCL